MTGQRAATSALGCGQRRDQSDSWVKVFEESGDPVTWNLGRLEHHPDGRLDTARALIALKANGFHTHNVSIS
jgi:hypothetical protein